MLSKTEAEMRKALLLEKGGRIKIGQKNCFKIEIKTGLFLRQVLMIEALFA